MTITSESLTEKEYQCAMDSFRTESAKFRKAQEAYRARKIDDAEFNARRIEFNAAQQVADYAESKVKRDFLGG